MAIHRSGLIDQNDQSNPSPVVQSPVFWGETRGTDLKDTRTNVWSQDAAIANPRALFDAVLSHGAQRVRLPNSADIVLTLEQTDKEAENSLKALLKRPDYPEGTE